MNVINEPLQRPWWKEPMIWLVAGLPAIAVVASFTTYFIAADKPDSLVNAGYHKEGMAPGKDTSREERAAALSIMGELAMVNGSARLKLSGQLEAMPASLELLLLHPTQSDQDVRIQLHGLGQGEYSGVMADGSQGKRQWVLEPNDRAWRLAGELTLPLAGSIKLSSQSIRNHP
jgi:hypothetical protein